MLDAARGDRLEALYSVALALGLRQGEALGLKWGDVDLDADMGAHGNVGAIGGMVTEMLGGRFVIGPSGGDPSHVLMAAIEAVGQTAEQLDKHYAMGKSGEVTEMRRRAWIAVETHAHWSAIHRKDA